MLAVTDLASRRPDATEWVPLSTITRDMRVNTRPVDEPWVDKHVPIFSPDAIGVLAVSRRADGTHVVLDGQHRMTLMRRAGWADQDVRCQIYEGLTVAEEAALFLALNDGRGLTAIDRFLARLTQGERSAVAINAIVEKAGWRIGTSRAPTASNEINAVSAIDRVYANDRSKYPANDHVNALTRTLECVTHAWGFQREAVHGSLLLGIGSVFVRYGDAVDTADLTRKLAGYPGGAAHVLGDARGLKQYHGGSVASNVAEVVVGLYNRQRRSRALPDWRTK